MFLNYSCHNEVYEVHNDPFGIAPKYSKQKVSISELIGKVPTFESFYNTLQLNKNNSTTQNKDINLSPFHYIKYIDTTTIVRYTGDNITTYTLPILTSLEKDKEDIFNLVIKNSEQSNSAFVIKYSKLNNLDAPSLEYFSADIAIYNSLGTLFSKGTINTEAMPQSSNKTGQILRTDGDGCQPSIEPIYSRCGCGGSANGHGPSGPPCCEGSPLIGFDITSCPSGDSSNNNNDGDTNDNTSEGDMFGDPFGDPGDGGPDGGSDGSGSPTVAVGINDLMEVLDTYDQLFGILLTLNQADWLLNNQEIDLQIRNYIVGNGFSNEAIEFSKLALEALQDNDNDGQPDGEVDFEENIIYESSFNDYPCQKLII
ncbi:MAG: hypothetical protein HKP48_11020 [Winogradskyella sp.]|uniref:hypothetical protein n=1 Tax=Winogradskyella sp. TaxID=1883156 RepID=UPI0017D93FAB|nr:hypothetical protein [Winogradskyella sp.]MBT8244127.1 hypothetical protein [Winogradskyella sp.]NNK23792.1 hypothetical protein [Winogradskyella sp.]